MADEKSKEKSKDTNPEKTTDSEKKFDARSLRFLKPIIPAGVTAAVVIGALSGYQAPVYTVKAASQSSENGQTNTAEKNSSSGKDSGKKASKKLPAVSKVSESGKKASSEKTSSGSGTAKKLAAVNDSGTTYKDGTYTGSAQGYGGPISVKVTVKNGKISSVSITGHSGETSQFFNKAKVLARRIQSSQTTNVDAVSGATYSSNGIINAVRNALSKAGGHFSSSSTTSSSGTKSSTKKTGKTTAKKKSTRKSKTTTQNAVYKDGTYTGSGTGFGGTIKVKVVIKDGKISKVTVTDHSGETQPYYGKASVLTKTIVKKQSTNVDAISGATFSSNGILDAADQALQKAMVKNSSTKNTSGKTTKNGSKTSNGSKKTDTKGKTDSDKKNSKNNETTQDTGTMYNPGTYTISSMVYPDEDEDFTEYNISLDVTIANDKITDIANVKAVGTNATNASYLKRAAFGYGSHKGIVTQIVAAGNADSVDAVSGATCSSEGILTGVKDALTKAQKSTVQADSQTVSEQTDNQTTSKNTDNQTDSEKTDTQDTSGKADNQTDSEKTGNQDTSGKADNQTDSEKADNKDTSGKADNQTDSEKADNRDTSGKTDSQNTSALTGKAIHASAWNAARNFFRYIPYRIGALRI